MTKITQAISLLWKVALLVPVPNLSLYLCHLPFLLQKRRLATLSYVTNAWATVISHSSHWGLGWLLYTNCWLKQGKELMAPVNSFSSSFPTVSVPIQVWMYPWVYPRGSGQDSGRTLNHWITQRECYSISKSSLVLPISLKKESLRRQYVSSTFLTLADHFLNREHASGSHFSCRQDYLARI